ncbi:MAG: molybdopterin-binding protein [Desulfobacterales bacterium]|nr:molybdopterin-binding protein [Desulfobacterales bacterium]
MPDKYKSSANIISLDDAVGTVLAHDITEIRPGQYKGSAFKKGHIILEEDLAHLRKLGKEHLYVLHIAPDELHENDAAIRLAKELAGPGVIYVEEPSEGKISLKSAYNGLLKVDVEALIEFNMIPEISCSSRHNNVLVNQGEIVAETRAIPLIINEKAVIEAEETAGRVNGIFSIKKLSNPKVGLIITGTEVYSGLIDDKFAPLIRKKFAEFDCIVKEPVFLPDDKVKIAEQIKNFLKMDMGLILVAGGMSVDPDDVSRLAVADAGAEDVVYGTPVLPGAMFLYGRFGDIPVFGLPACVLFFKSTVLDLLLPRVLAGERISRRDLAEMAHGGLCLHCEECRYPACPFGK